MKIVQSFWSKPYLESNVHNDFFFKSWILSSWQLRQFHERVELVTDEVGYDILIKQLELPYTDVKIILDQISDYPSQLWAAGKLLAYGVQKEPFLHLDSDIYIWQPLDLRPDDDLVCFHFEKDRDIYQKYLESLKSYVSYVPECLEHIFKQGANLNAANAAVLGGNNIDFIHKYVSEAFLFIDKNLTEIRKAGENMANFNVIFEQLLFYNMAHPERQIRCYVPDEYARYHSFSDAPDKVNIIHARRDYRDDLYLRKRMEYLLTKRYPEALQRMERLESFNKTKTMISIEEPDHMAHSYDETLNKLFPATINELSRQKYIEQREMLASEGSLQIESFEQNILQLSNKKLQRHLELDKRFANFKEAIQKNDKSFHRIWQEKLDNGQKLLDLPDEELFEKKFKLSEFVIIQQLDEKHISFLDIDSLLHGETLFNYLADYGMSAYIFEPSVGIGEYITRKLGVDLMLFECFRKNCSAYKTMDNLMNYFEAHGQEVFDQVAKMATHPWVKDTKYFFKDKLEFKIKGLIGCSVIVPQ
ncbi:MAG: DUF6734 family protein [Bacteroidota bacterium]